MKKFDNNRYIALKNVGAFMALYDTQLQLILIYDTEKDLFVALMTLLDLALLKESEDIREIAKNKAITRSAMITIMRPFVLAAIVQANQLHKFELENNLKNQLAALSKAESTRTFNIATDIKKLLQTNLSELTIITSANITTIGVGISAFEAIQNRPKQAIENKAAQTTAVIPDLLTQLTESKIRIGNLVEFGAPALLAEFKKAAKVGKPTGTRHLSLHIKFVFGMDKIPVKGIKCTIVSGDTTHTKKSTARGLTQFHSLANAPWQITGESKIYNTIVEEVVTNDNKIVRLEIQLHKINPTGDLLIIPLNKNTGDPMPNLHLAIPSINRAFDAGQNTQIVGTDIPVGNYEGTLSGTHIQDQNITFAITPETQTTITFNVDPTPPTLPTP
ncbi:MAG: hypothetical protein WCH34_01170 [Bacteroidota bacterium]